MRPLPDYISIFFCLAELSGYYVCGVTQSLKALTISRTSSLGELLSPSREYTPVKDSSHDAAKSCVAAYIYL